MGVLREATLCVEELIQQVPCGIGVLLGPEHGDELVPTHADVPGNCEQCEQGELTALGDGPGDRCIVEKQADSAKGREMEHDKELTRS